MRLASTMLTVSFASATMKSKRIGLYESNTSLNLTRPNNDGIMILKLSMVLNVKLFILHFQ